MTYDGVNRRKEMGDDHDLLTRLETKLDKALEQIVDHETRLRWHEKVIYGLGGAVLLVQVIMKVIN